ncbi:DUF192 domain-containing protein [bacterium]|nr:DUF192 domain-containing protein [bacterium]MCI0602285.1 DUF192 domain-containing protein [bacterium]
MRTLVFLLPIFIVLAFGIRSTLAAQKLPAITVLVNATVKIEAELAYTDANRSRGLMFRENMPSDAGMLFVFPELDVHSFWMKNTLIPLDILWLNERKEVVYLVTAQPCKTNPCDSMVPLQKSKYVLEVNAGFAKKHKIDIGSQIEFTIPAEIEKNLR